MRHADILRFRFLARTRDHVVIVRVWRLLESSVVVINLSEA